MLRRGRCLDSRKKAGSSNEKMAGARSKTKGSVGVLARFLAPPASPYLAPISLDQIKNASGNLRADLYMPVFRRLESSALALTEASCCTLPRTRASSSDRRKGRARLVLIMPTSQTGACQLSATLVGRRLLVIVPLFCLLPDSPCSNSLSDAAERDGEKWREIEQV